MWEAFRERIQLMQQAIAEVGALGGWRTRLADLSVVGNLDQESSPAWDHCVLDSNHSNLISKLCRLQCDTAMYVL